MKDVQKELLNKVKNLVTLERQTTAEILKDLCFVEKDKLYLELGYNSLFQYLVRELKHSEGEATRRINACRLMKEFPQIIPAVIEGKLNLTNLSRAAQSFKQTNLEQSKKQVILKKLEGKTTRQAELILFEMTDLKLEIKEKERRISKTEVSVSFVLTEEERIEVEKLKTLKNRTKVMSTKDLFLSLVKTELNKFELRSTAEIKSIRTKRLARGVLAAKVLKRADFKCEVKECGETKFLQIHHLKPYRRGGYTEFSNLELLCHGHHMKTEMLIN